MSTRGAVGFRIGRSDKVSYNHSDSYPSWLGKNVISFIRDTKFMDIEAAAQNIVLVDEESTPTLSQIAECEKWGNVEVGNQSIADWYCLLRESQGNLYAYTNGLKYMLNGNDFLYDSLFCEYAYIINVTTGKLEFYLGFNRSKKTNRGRYASKTKDDQYYGVMLMKTYDLGEIYGMSDRHIEDIVADMDSTVESFESKQKNKSF